MAQNILYISRGKLMCTCYHIEHAHTYNKATCVANSYMKRKFTTPGGYMPRFVQFWKLSWFEEMRPAGFNDIYLDNMVTTTFLLTLGTRQIKRKHYSCHPSNKRFFMFTSHSSPSSFWSLKPSLNWNKHANTNKTDKERSY